MSRKEKLEEKRKIRKMARRMLWADFKGMILGWRVFLLVMLYVLFFLLPYTSVENLNISGMYYFVTWVIMAVSAMVEDSFNYLPLSSKSAAYYLKSRTNCIILVVLVSSVLTGVVLKLFGEAVFWERGLFVLLGNLVTVEVMFTTGLYEYSKPQDMKFTDERMPQGRKVFWVFYWIYGIVLLLWGMMAWIFMKQENNNKTILLVYFCACLLLLVFRGFAADWVKLEEYRKEPRRNPYASLQQQKQQES